MSKNVKFTVLSFGLLYLVILISVILTCLTKNLFKKITKKFEFQKNLENISLLFTHPYTAVHDFKKISFSAASREGISLLSP